MASKSGQRVRLVKCPKCLKILQEDEDVPVYQCGGCSAILQAKKRSFASNTTPSKGGAEGAQASEPSEGGAVTAKASEPRSEPKPNNVSSSSGEEDRVLPSPTGRVDEKALDGSLESTEKQLGGSIVEEGDEIQLQERSLGDSDKNEGEDNLKSDIKPVAEAIAPGTTSSRSLNAVDHVVNARTSNSSSDAYRKLEAEISPDSSPVEEEQNEDDYFFNRHRESTDDHLANKTCSTYDGSESSSDEREDELLDENENWKTLQEINSVKFQRQQRYPEYNFKEQRRGSSSSTAFSDKRPNYLTTTTYMERYQNRSLQLEGPGGRLGRQGRNHMTRPNIPFYTREPYTRVSPSYPSQDEFDGYSRAHSLQMPPYESVDHMYHNITRARGRVQGSRFSGEMTNDRRRNHPGWYSGQLHSSHSSYHSSPQRPMEQKPAYYPRWSHEIVSDVEDHQRNRHAGHGHHHDLQVRRLKERQRVAKRHIRPTAGGAPFVSCYSCSENLQLPVDFLIFKRKYHLLRCGRCTTVLRFSLQSGTHLVPAVKRDINANRSSNSTLEFPRDKAPSKQPQKPNSSAQEEEIPVARGSPLHRLMGYSTVSQVFKASQRPPSL